MSIAEKYTIWNLRHDPHKQSNNYQSIDTDSFSSSTAIPYSICYWCQCTADAGPSLCKRCDRIQMIRECTAEFLSMMILMFVGTAATAQWYLSAGVSGSYASTALAWGIATTFGVYISQGVSGSHMNPVVTLSSAILHKFPWRRVIPYLLAQLAGTIVAGLLVFIEYKDMIYTYEAYQSGSGSTTTTTPYPYPYPTFPPYTNSPLSSSSSSSSLSSIKLSDKTSPIFLVSPSYFLSFNNFLIDQIFGTAVQCLGIAALTDYRNSSTAPPHNLTPLLIGGWISIIVLSFGANAGFPFNPARNYGMQIAAGLVGYSNIWYGWEWTYLLFPLFGGLLGIILYDLLIKIHHTPLYPHLWSKYCAEKNGNALIKNRLEMYNNNSINNNNGAINSTPLVVDDSINSINNININTNTTLSPKPLNYYSPIHAPPPPPPPTIIGGGGYTIGGGTGIIPSSSIIPPSSSISPIPPSTPTTPISNNPNNIPLQSYHHQHRHHTPPFTPGTVSPTPTPLISEKIITVNDNNNNNNNNNNTDHVLHVRPPVTHDFLYGGDSSSS